MKIKCAERLTKKRVTLNEKKRKMTKYLDSLESVVVVYMKRSISIWRFGALWLWGPVHRRKSHGRPVETTKRTRHAFRPSSFSPPCRFLPMVLDVAYVISDSTQAEGFGGWGTSTAEAEKGEHKRPRAT